MIDDATFGGYLEVHDRAPAFEGPDGLPYSAALYVDDEPDERGRYGAAILFVRWSEAGDRPVGHVESPYLAYAKTPEEASDAVRRLTLHEVKEQLDRAIAVRPENGSW